MRRTLGTARLLALFGAGVLVFHDPLLRLWDRAGTLWGLPLAPVALFGLWALLIGVLAWVMERGSADERDGERADAAGDGAAARPAADGTAAATTDRSDA